VRQPLRSTLFPYTTLFRSAVRRGLRTKSWVKTSMAPGSKVVTQYLNRAGLNVDLEALRFHTVGYGCTSCIGNSGPLPPHIAEARSEEHTSELQSRENLVCR